jgi:hypothetical protein
MLHICHCCWESCKPQRAFLSNWASPYRQNVSEPIEFAIFSSECEPLHRRLLELRG